MDPAPKHIDYYCKTYMRLYPSARIILSTMNTKEFRFQFEARRRLDVKEAVSAILAPDQAQERSPVSKQLMFLERGKKNFT
jgi:hypothetical protein